MKKKQNPKSVSRANAHEESKKIVKLLYIGKRFGDKKSFDVFLNGDKEVYFSKRRFCVIGYYYEAEQGDKGRLLMTKYPKCLGESELADELLEPYRLQDTLAEETERHLKLGKKLNVHKGLKEAIEILKPLCEGMGFRNREITMRYILDQLEQVRIQKQKLSMLKTIKRMEFRNKKRGNQK